MSRIRSIKPEFFTSEDIVGLSPLARLFYIALWCECDREGRLEWKPRTFKLRYLPGDSVEVEMLATELIDAGLVILYAADGKNLAEIPSFTKHQVINNREAASTLPERVSTREARVKAEGKEGRKGRESTRADDVPRSADLGDAGSSLVDAAPPPVVNIPLNDGSEHGISDVQVAEWSAAFPGVDVVQTLRQMRAWCLAKPQNRKTRRGVDAFVVSWLGREQDKRPRGGVGSGRHAQAEEIL